MHNRQNSLHVTLERRIPDHGPRRTDPAGRAGRREQGTGSREQRAGSGEQRAWSWERGTDDGRRGALKMVVGERSTARLAAMPSAQPSPATQACERACPGGAPGPCTPSLRFWAAPSGATIAACRAASLRSGLAVGQGFAPSLLGATAGRRAWGWAAMGRSRVLGPAACRRDHPMSCRKVRATGRSARALLFQLRNCRNRLRRTAVSAAAPRGSARPMRCNWSPPAASCLANRFSR